MTEFALWHAAIWKDMFVPAIPLAEKVLRPVIVYVFLVIFLRIFGKRELAQLNPFDLVVLLSLSNIVQNAFIGNDNSLSGGLIGAFTLLGVNYLVVRLLFNHPRLDLVVEGSPTRLIDNGHVQSDALKQELMSPAELLTVAHRQGFGSLDEIEECVLESSGMFDIKGKRPSGEERRQSELLNRLDQLSRQIETLRAELPSAGNTR